MNDTARALPCDSDAPGATHFTSCFTDMIGIGLMIGMIEKILSWAD
jgi:hypothetical protein